MSRLLASDRPMHFSVSTFSALLVALSVAYPIKNAPCAIEPMSHRAYPSDQPDRLERAIACSLSLSSPMQRAQFRSDLPEPIPAAYWNSWHGPQPKKTLAPSLSLQSKSLQSDLGSIHILGDIEGKQHLETQTLGLTLSPKSNREGSVQRAKPNILNYLMSTFVINHTRDYTEFQVHLPY